MKTTLKRAAAAFIAAVMLLSVFAACAKPVDDDAETMPAVSEADVTVPDEPEEEPAPPQPCDELGLEHVYGEWGTYNFTLDRLCRTCTVCGARDFKSGWVSPDEVPGCTISDGIRELAATMPHASYDDLPLWNGVSIHTLSALGVPARMDGFATNPATIQKMVDYGFNYSRVTLDMRCFFRDETMQEANTKAFLELDSIISQCVENGIHVSLNSHYDFGRDYDDAGRDTTFKNQAQLDGFVRFWEFLADRYSDISSNALDFDLMNEPRSYNSKRQYIDLMNTTIDAIRAISPDRLIVVEMADWSSTPVPELAEKQVVEAFHYYVPNTVENSETWWTPESVYEKIKSFVDFGDKYGIKVILNECGAVFTSPAQDTAAWFDATFDACRQLGVSWNMHDVSGYFGFATYDKWCIREDTKHAVMTDEGTITYIYPDIYESFEKNIDPSRVKLTADSLRELVGHDPSRYILSFQPTLFAADGSELPCEYGADFDRCKGIFGGEYILNWHAPEVPDGQKMTGFAVTSVVYDYNYNYTTRVTDLSEEIFDAIVVTGDGTVYELDSFLGEYDVSNGYRLYFDLPDEVINLSPEEWRSADILVMISLDEPEIG